VDFIEGCRCRERALIAGEPAGKVLATKGVLVNCITPATFQSPILEQLPPSQVEYMRSRIPMGRLGEIHETTAMACWLASDECSFSTGATFDTSGGRTTY
jgi:3-oxoacyl-[acyl-carrier protein] reductase